MESNFWPHFAKILAEKGSKMFEGLNKNPATFVSQEFSPRTAAKGIMEKY